MGSGGSQPDCNHFEFLGLFADDLHISFTKHKIVPDSDASLNEVTIEQLVKSLGPIFHDVGEALDNPALLLNCFDGGRSSTERHQPQKA
jgi:hypothetical protein